MRWKKSVLILILGLGIVNLSSCKRQSNTQAGLEAYQNGSYQIAVEYFQAAITNDSTNIGNYIYEGMAYLALNNNEEAKKAFLLAKNIDDSEEMVERGLGILAYHENDYETAVDYFNKAINLSPNMDKESKKNILLYLGDSQVQLKLYEEAVATYTSLDEISTDESEVLYHRGCCYLLLGENKLAMEDFSLAIKGRSATYPLYWNIYQQLVNAKENEKAMTYLDKALTLPVENKESYKYSGIFYYLKEDFSLAIKNLEKSDLNDIESVTYLARAYEKDNQKENAVKVFQTAIKNAANPLALYNQYGLFLLDTKQYTKAIAIFQKGIETGDSQETEMLAFNLIVAYEKCQDYKTAMNKLLSYETIYGASDELEKEKEFLDTRFD